MLFLVESRFPISHIHHLKGGTTGELFFVQILFFVIHPFQKVNGQRDLFTVCMRISRRAKKAILI